jgi:hypothetical protein
MAARSVRFWLHAEGFAALIAGIAIYGWAGLDWVWLIPLLLLPDLSIVGFVAGPAVGSLVYNAVHNWALALALLGVGLSLTAPALTIAGAILVAHVGLDRLLGYGLKYPTAFRDTHISRA